MNIYTLNVGQGQFVVVTGASEAIIVDTWVPGNTDQDVEIVVQALPKILSQPGAQKNLVGLVITGFDSDHFTPKGLNIVLGRYFPAWLAYPKYFKESQQATDCFEAIKKKQTYTEVERISVRLEGSNPKVPVKWTSNFKIEFFGPMSKAMDTSNNSSLVCKITEISTGTSYLVTGDTENGAWPALIAAHGSQLQANVVAAPHHGSKNGMTQALLNVVQPHTVIVSAGVDSQYGHPSEETLALLKRNRITVHGTCWGEGQSLNTVLSYTGPGASVNTFKFSAK